MTDLPQLGNLGEPRECFKLGFKILTEVGPLLKKKKLKSQTTT